jgi:hypothetical protein
VPHPALDAIGGNPAKALRKFVDLGLLIGPARSQKIGAAPFAITPAGLEVLRRVERGLHEPSWLNRSKLHALEALVRYGGSAARATLIHNAKVRPAALDALAGAGYVEAGESNVVLTELGWEAYRETGDS